jgi:hypothetical protein
MDSMAKTITFAELRHFLLGLGFVEDTVRGGFLRFQHDPSDTRFIFRAYKATDRVNPGDLVAVRRFLDERGLMEADEFDRFLGKTPA